MSEAILAYNKDRYPQGEFACESHVTIGGQTTVSTPGAGEKSASLTFTYYVMAYYQVYSTYGGELKEEGGSYMPVRLTFKTKMADQNYELSEYWTPSSGRAEYVSEIKENFPESYVQQALDTQQYAEKLRQQCYEKALAYLVTR